MTKPYYETELGKLYHGDCLETLKQMPAESVDCVMTSPPYWALRDYGIDGQLGLEATFQEYIEKLIQIFNDVKRVLKQLGTCWINIGDTYGTQSGMSRGKDYQPNRKFNVMQGSILIKQDGFHKSLVGIPERFSIAMTDRGWIKRNTIIWHKPNCMPSSSDDRFTVDFEYLYFFTKSKQYYFEQQKERVVSSKSDIKKMVEGKDRIGGIHKDLDDRYNKASKYTNIGRKRSVGDPSGRNKRCVWRIPTKSFPEAHFAVYPEQLCYTPIKAGCPKNGVVLDPFAGAGTTLLVAEKLNRQWIGIEISKEYCDIMVDRMKKETAQYKMAF